MSAVSLPAPPSFRLDGRRALVTGAGRGIGLALASALADAGAEVTLCARSLPEVASAADAIRTHGGVAYALQLDVTDIDAVSAALALAEPFDILVNNAGANRPNPLEKVSTSDFDFVMGLNVRAAYFTAQAVAKRLIAVGRAGSIIKCPRRWDKYQAKMLANTMLTEKATELMAQVQSRLFPSDSENPEA
jgi:NAD(P)-dependent dehydrogenase (short-subunit alcohol dehydrogenase family)